MRINDAKTTFAVLIHVPRPLYSKYLGMLLQRNLKTQAYNANVFIKAIKTEIEEYQKSSEKDNKVDSIIE